MDINDLDFMSQKNLNSRLNGCWLRFMTATEFEADEYHPPKQITIVDRNGDLELWKGDIKILPSGGMDVDGYFLLFVDSFQEV